MREGNIVTAQTTKIHELDCLSLLGQLLWLGEYQLNVLAERSARAGRFLTASRPTGELTPTAQRERFLLIVNPGYPFIRRNTSSVPRRAASM